VRIDGRFEKGSICIGREDCRLDTPREAVVISQLDGNGVDFVEKKSGMRIPFRLVDSNERNPIPANPSQPVSITRMDLTKKELTMSESVRNINYAGGSLTIGGVKFTVMRATGPIVTVMEEPKLPFFLVDDDVTPHPFTVDTSLMQRSVDAALNLFAPAYIQPVYDLGPGSKQPGFNRNVEDELKEIQDQLESGREKVSTNEYWVAYIQGAFQGPTVPTPDRSGDADPNIEGGIGGATPTFFDTSPPSDLRQGSLIFVEVIRDRGAVLRAG
jgi:hypothetical protein